MKLSKYVAGGIAFAAMSAGAGAARADEAEPVDGTVTVLAGTVTALLPFIGGTTLIAEADGKKGRNNGTMIMLSGFTLAPLVAHGVAGEWKRGLFFAAIPAAAEIGMAAAIAVQDTAVVRAKRGIQITYAGITTLSLFAAAVGVIDAAYARERWHERQKVSVTPVVAPSFAGLTVGGVL